MARPQRYKEGLIPRSFLVLFFIKHLSSLRTTSPNQHKAFSVLLYQTQPSKCTPTPPAPTSSSSLPSKPPPTGPPLLAPAPTAAPPPTAPLPTSSFSLPPKQVLTTLSTVAARTALPPWIALPLLPGSLFSRPARLVLTTLLAPRTASALRPCSRPLRCLLASFSWATTLLSRLLRVNKLVAFPFFLQQLPSGTIASSDATTTQHTTTRTTRHPSSPDESRV